MAGGSEVADEEVWRCGRCGRFGRCVPRFRTKKHRMVSCLIVALPLVLRVYVDGDREVTEQTNSNLPGKVPADIVFLCHSHSHGRGLEPWNQLSMNIPSHSYSNSYSEVLLIHYGNEEEFIEEGIVEN